VSRRRRRAEGGGAEAGGRASAGRASGGRAAGERASGGRAPTGRPAADGPPAGAAPGRGPYRIRPLYQVAILLAVFALVTLIAELAGAANLGVALGIAQIVFGVALVVVLVRS
jgi:hypothetical protein